MFEKYVNWSNKYNDEIAWFVIGILTQSSLVSLSRGDWNWFCLEVALIAVNYFFWKERQE